MRISLSTGTLFTFPLGKVMAIARDAGFDGVELIVNQDFQKVNCRTLIRELAEILPIHSMHAPFMPLDGWGSSIDSLKRCVELSADCGVQLVNFHPPSWMGFELGFWRWLYRVMDFQKEVGQGGVIVTLENMPWVGKRVRMNPHILSSTTKFIDFIQERNLFMTFDTTHMGSGKANFINDFYLCYNSGRIRNIHFSDYGHGREHLLPGHGILPLTRFLNHLRSTGYNDTLTLELSPEEFPRDERIIVESLREILSYLRKETEHPIP
ncbi:Xylose isomerase domain protein TIM barrel [Geobacter metallireducens RCH3]|uniref:TIM alpha/beta-barrel protein n=1 Tax=Geobacter metallireducens (strain ATCC 53774 / DSM 7210 / GS-15) TaxID=269799 RepID=Q39R80_GEOMG|nr:MULTISPECIES: sugar phosphate isomerase/epimerase family protein [Geobacter]ABB33244.1 TIM alpha/beta-barrel protein [Geobacter metallireducens GS-15]EHP84679.1 Xylose isomerase domain protein TIM barrel [Geobacter metallireducens RCH3]MBT1074899.1 sugar phosphate isomerase/epimerase [Geobacter grbiciae]